MRALEPGALGDARHAAVLAREKMLEVHSLERFARLAIRTIERYLRQRAGRRARGERALHVFELYFFLERREREVFHHAFQLRKVPRPWVMTQRVERGDRQPPRRADAPRSSEGASASSSALARNGAPGATSSRAKSSGRMPRSPRSIKGAADCASCARRFLASASAVERPSAASAS